MTKLPEREDGGIDWEKIYDWIEGLEEPHPAVRRRIFSYMKQISTHTIGRCAKVADEHCVFHESRAKSDTEAYGKAALDIRDTIRKLEV